MRRALRAGELNCGGDAGLAFRVGNRADRYRSGGVRFVNRRSALGIKSATVSSVVLAPNPGERHAHRAPALSTVPNAYGAGSHFPGTRSQRKAHVRVPEVQFHRHGNGTGPTEIGTDELAIE